VAAAVGRRRSLVGHPVFAARCPQAAHPRYHIGRTTEEKWGLREETPTRPPARHRVRRVDERARHLSHGRRLFVGAH
jgi:hypothetical protein